MTEVPTVALKPSGVIPMIGFGTWRLNDEACTRAVETALASGYRHIDTADGYSNHEAVGAAIENSRIPREKLFITTKVGRDDLHESDVFKICDRALQQLKLDYIDLYLVHWPHNDIPLEETFEAMRRLLADGRIRAFGVSNFTLSRLERALALQIAPIACNQVEYHPLLNQKDLHRFCQDHGVALTAYSPLAQGKISENALIKTIAHKYGKTPAQVTLRWLIQRQIIVIPKAASPEHIVSNFQVFDFELAAEDFNAIDNMNVWERLITWDVAEFDK